MGCFEAGSVCLTYSFKLFLVFLYKLYKKSFWGMGCVERSAFVGKRFKRRYVKPTPQQPASAHH